MTTSESFRVRLWDGWPSEGAEVVWEGTSDRLVKDNDEDPAVIEVVEKLAAGERYAATGGGAMALFVVENLALPPADQERPFGLAIDEIAADDGPIPGFDEGA